MMALENLLSELLLASMDVGVQFLSVLSDGEFMVIVHCDVDLLLANWLILRLMEQLHVRVLECIFGRRTFGRVELQQSTHQVQGIV